MRSSIFRALALAAGIGLGALGSAQAVEYTTLDSEASQVTFGYSQMNVKMDGRFGQLAATALQFDPARPAEAKVTIEIALSSVDAGYDDANAELEKNEWLAVAEYPVATLTSSQIKALGDNAFEATGDLSIKGITKTFIIPFTFKEDGNVGHFEGSFTFPRTDFAIGEGQWKDFSIVANDIQVNFLIVAKP